MSSNTVVLAVEHDEDGWSFEGMYFNMEVALWSITERLKANGHYLPITWFTAKGFPVEVTQFIGSFSNYAENTQVIGIVQAKPRSGYGSWVLFLGEYKVQTF